MERTATHGEGVARVATLAVVVILVASLAGPALADPTQESFPRASGSDHVVAPGETVTIELAVQDVNSIKFEPVPTDWEIVSSTSDGTDGQVEQLDSGDRVVGWVFPEAVANRTATVTLRVPEDAATDQYRFNVSAEHVENGMAHASTIVNVNPDADSLVIPEPNAHGPYTVVEGESAPLDPVWSEDPDGTVAGVTWLQLGGNGEIDNQHFFPPNVIATNETATVELQILDNDGLLATQSAQILVLQSEFAPETPTPEESTPRDPPRTPLDDESGASPVIGGIGTLVLVFLLVVLVYHRRE
ncbi:hypothetical protein [Halococcoides cellulosivorans]|uniref:Uncharacterized protein n=1 Tax=Halococcoides cellulosivorans TaxID=1679096 RepID=A0A2R4X353_9EURY|nr:hypothetical protein [Halococcoides cellulosivorans]AWB28228.1 hypothetical protein HARCEL1_11195 [Halococcoides cellulosivorans]